MRVVISTLLIVYLTCAACGDAAEPAAPEAEPAHDGPERSELVLAPEEADTAVFAMGCFWCAETAFEGQPGIADVVSGFAGGTVPNPTYDQVTAGGTGHYESVQVVYAPAQTDYSTLLRIFWHNVDPVDDGGQFCDRGDSYRAAIFPSTSVQRRLAEESLAMLTGARRFAQPVVIQVLPTAEFYPAEEYHQDFWLKDPDRYYSYRTGCRRDQRLDVLWGDRARVASDSL